MVSTNMHIDMCTQHRLLTKNKNMHKSNNNDNEVHQEISINCRDFFDSSEARSESFMYVCKTA